MKKLITFAVCLLSLLLIGCGASDPMVGTWKLQLDDNVKALPAEMRPNAMAEFKADKTFTVSLKAGTRAEDMTGTYTLEGKTLVMTATSEGGKPASDKETVTLADDMKSFPLPGSSGMGKMVKQ